MKGGRVLDRSVIEAAWRRGLSASQVALAAGISTQAVSDRWRRYGLDHSGRKHRGKSKKRTQMVCAHCGVRLWLEEGKVRPNNPLCDPSRVKNIKSYCSQVCNGLAKHKLSKDQILYAITLRINNSAWKDVKEEIGEHTQTIQRDIWLFLFDSGFLTHDILYQIWKPSNSLHRRSFPWQWLVNSHGVSPDNSRRKFAQFKKVYDFA